MWAAAEWYNGAVLPCIEHSSIGSVELQLLRALGEQVNFAGAWRSSVWENQPE